MSGLLEPAMPDLFGSIGTWFKDLLIDGITSNFSGMFDEVNKKTGEIASQVGQTPAGWNTDIFSLIRNLSDTVIIPVAGMILTFVMCYELIQLIIEKNNLHDFETFVFFKWIFKTFCAAYILTHTFDIVMGVFTLAQQVVNGSAGVIQGSLDINLAMDSLADELKAMEIGELIGLYMESAILSLAMKAISLCIFIIVYGRMIEMYLVASVAPIPLSTMTNREWGQMGNGYLKSLFALAFQGFLIMVCIAIYAVLLQNITVAGNIHSSILSCAGYSILLGFMLFRSGSISKGIFGAH
jgi:hypothetical protein